MRPLILIAGPCVIESHALLYETARRLKEITDKLGIDFIFKSSYKKANRTRLDSFIGIGDKKALEFLYSIKQNLKVKVISDVHECCEMELASQILDVIQIPAYLSRQTELIKTVCETGLSINIKKGQFMAPKDIHHALEKVFCHKAPNAKVFVTERGSCFGYNNLVVDFEGLSYLKSKERFYHPKIIFDVTHSIQKPSMDMGNTKAIPDMVNAAVALGVDGLFIETHPKPEIALCDGANMVPLNDMELILQNAIEIRRAYERTIAND